MFGMRRREFVSLLGGAAAWPLAARAQQPAMPVIGFLHAGSLDGYANRRGIPPRPRGSGIRPKPERGDRIPLGGRPIRPNAGAGFRTDRPSGGRAGRGGGGLSVRAARTATTTIPIVFTSVPIRCRRPCRQPETARGQRTGVSFVSRCLGAKALELIRELLPKATAIAVLQNSENPIRPEEMRGIECGCSRPWTTAATIVGQHRRRDRPSFCSAWPAAARRPFALW